MTSFTWQPVLADGSVLVLKYSFGFGTANTMAIKLGDRSWLVMSPCVGAPVRALDELGDRGPVRALLAPNAFHHLGHAAWRARFPEAVSYAPAGSLARLAKKASSIPFHSSELLARSLPGNVQVLEPEGMKQPDLMLRATSSAGTAWFTGDVLSNTSAADVAALPRFIFGVLGGGSGYRLNRVPSLVYLADRARWTAAVRTAVDRHPPTVVVPGHGDPVHDDAAARTSALLA